LKKSFLYAREKYLISGSVLFLALIVSLAFIAGIQVVFGDPDEGEIGLYPQNVSWLVGSEPVDKKFSVQMNITNISSITGIVFSFSWDSSLLNLTDVKFETDCIFGTAGSPAPSGTGGTIIVPTGWKTITYFSDGNFSQQSYSELPTFVPLTFSSPAQGKVVTLTFEYVGAAPSIGSPVDTEIFIVDNDYLLPGGYKMATKWVKLITPPANVQDITFNVLGSCHFHYQVVETLIHNVDGYDVVTVSKSSVSDMTLSIPQLELRFNVTGLAGVSSFCNVTIPKALLNAEPLEAMNVTVNSASPDSLIRRENTTHTFVDFTYTHTSTQQVVIKGTWVIPEFPTLTFLTLLLIATLALATLGKIWSAKRRNRLLAT